MNRSSVTPSLLRVGDGETLAYYESPGKTPGVVFLTGYKSDMTGQKAVHLEAFCRARGQAFVRFDYYGHGASSGNFVDGTIGRWRDDTVRVLDELTAGPQVLVGSSLGGWIMLLTALVRPARVAGMIGIAAAPDFTEDLLPPLLTPSDRVVLDEGGIVNLSSAYDPEPTPINKRFLDNGREHLLLLNDIALDCPVRLIHGMQDPDVPWQTSLRLLERLRSADVELTLLKNGDHRLSMDDDLQRLSGALEQLLNHLTPEA
ncbi:MAG: alpha/beta hydrolase [Rhodospirillales bacterium]|nr:alpha/beta hydrolase [Rhodospirillales bacterium]